VYYGLQCAIIKFTNEVSKAQNVSYTRDALNSNPCHIDPQYTGILLRAKMLPT